MIEYYCVYISVELTLLSIRVLCALILTLWINPLHSTKHFSSRLFCVVFFFLTSIAVLCMQQEQLVSLKSCLLFIQKNIGLYVKRLYLCIQIDLHMFLIHTSCAEVSYIILSGGSTSKIFSTVT